ncbi:regulatory protein RecX [Brevibacterium casei]|uniref:regulatory protein RecX n=1 Tax=Brevibacterium TaxID=1696 RepID=UPI00142F9027|nr:regulatory protein RecX [Brevibacterium casei]NJE65449.1 regulatory protein RecX [Brevibacterium sp. LS14]QQT67992.1 regulatory protein RecX [Brevibacterium casei]
MSEDPTTLTDLRRALSDLESRQAAGGTGFFARLDAGDAEETSGTGSEGAVGSADSAEAGPGSARSAQGVPGAGPSAGEPAGTVPDEPFADSPELAEAYAKAKRTALNMLAMRDHSSTELREKLLRRDIEPAVVDRLITKLEHSNLLDDTQFAQRFAKAQRESRKLSRSALRRQLVKKGIDEETIAGVVDEVDGEEDLAREVAEKKARSTRGLAHEVRERRILGMLARRGFSSTICLKVTREVLAET